MGSRHRLGKSQFSAFTRIGDESRSRGKFLHSKIKLKGINRIQFLFVLYKLYVHVSVLKFHYKLTKYNLETSKVSVSLNGVKISHYKSRLMTCLVNISKNILPNKHRRKMISFLWQIVNMRNFSLQNLSQQIRSGQSTKRFAWFMVRNFRGVRSRNASHRFIVSS